VHYPKPTRPSRAPVELVTDVLVRDEMEPNDGGAEGGHGARRHARVLLGTRSMRFSDMASHSISSGPLWNQQPQRLFVPQPA